MSYRKRFGCGLLVVSACLMSGCNPGGHKPLLFLQTDTIGVGASAGQAAQPIDVTVAYKGFNYARVPVAKKDEHGNLTGIGAKHTNKKTGTVFTGAQSVFGRFRGNVGVAAGGPVNVGLQKFFTTGFAAQQLARGYQVGIPNAVKKGEPLPY